MSFKENILRKIKIEKLTRKILDSVGPPDSGKRFDRDAMIELLEMGSYEALKKRDLVLYILEGNADNGRIFVLDNDLTIYNTSAEDIAVRKSPTVKEMVTIRNIRRILNDSDVVESEKEETVRSIRKEYLDKLDLSFEPADINAIAREGIADLEAGNPDGVRECLEIFADILGYRSAPSPFKIDGYDIMGKISRGDSGELVLSPVVIFDPSQRLLKLMDVQIERFDKEGIESIHRVAKGIENDCLEGAGVFGYLKEAVGG
jgi:hypothetical protein